MSMLPPAGRRRSWVHYGVMMPGLPEPHRYVNLMAIAGTPGVRIFANDHLVRTTPNDTAYVVSATSSMSRDQFRGYSMSAECEFAADGSRVRFSDDLELSGRLPQLRLRREHSEVPVRLDIEVFEVVTRFVDLPGVYRHWSRLARASGTVGPTPVEGLCTVEYASGVGLHSLLDRPLPVQLPGRLFTYHVLTIDDETQLLFTHVLGPAGLPVQRAGYLRTRSGARRFRRGHRWQVSEYTERVTPDGRRMRLPHRFAFRAAGVGEIRGAAADDWVYGLGAGYVGSYDYEGRVEGRAVAGRGYCEYIDCR